MKGLLALSLHTCYKMLKRLAHTGLTFDLDLPEPISNPWLHMLVQRLYIMVLWRLACLPQTENELNTHTPLYKWEQVHEQTNTLHKHTHTQVNISERPLFFAFQALSLPTVFAIFGIFWNASENIDFCCMWERQKKLGRTFSGAL